MSLDEKSMKQLVDMLKLELGKEEAEKYEAKRAAQEEQAVRKNFASELPTNLAQGGARSVDLAPKSKGSNFGRYMKCLALGGNDPNRAYSIAKSLDPNHTVTKALGESTIAGGGAMVPGEVSGELIEELGAQSTVLSFPVRQVGMKGSLTFSYVDSSATASWTGESVAVNASEPTFGNLQLANKWLSVQVPVSNSFIRDNSTGSDAFIMDHIIRVAQRKLDSDLIRNVGVSYAPQGLYGQAYTKFNANTTETLITRMAELTRAIREVAEENVPIDNRCGWIFSWRTYGDLMSIQNSNGYPAFRDEMMRGTLLGHPFKVTSQIPDNLGSGTDESEIYFANFGGEIFALGNEMAVEAFNGGAYVSSGTVTSGLSRDETVFRLMLACDFGSIWRGKNISVIETVEWGS